MFCNVNKKRKSYCPENLFNGSVMFVLFIFTSFSSEANNHAQIATVASKIMDSEVITLSHIAEKSLQTGKTMLYLYTEKETIIINISCLLWSFHR